MNGEQILDLFYEIVDDEEISSDSAYILMNNAEDMLEDARDWMILRAKDTSLSHSTSDTYSTQHSLPTRFKRARKVFLRGSAGVPQEIFPVSFEELEAYQSTNGYYAIDYANSKIHITGSYGETMTIILNYIKRAPTIDEDETVVWPGKYGAILAFDMAQIYSGGIDGDDVNFRMSEKQEKQRYAIYQGMVQWDGGLQLAEMGGQAGMNPRQK